MTVLEKGPAQRPAYADGKTKLMLIDGRWVAAASGKTFESRNPATGELLAHVAEGDREDINRAVAAARKAFTGPWSKWKSAERQAVLLRLADLVEQHIEELAALDTYDMGAPISRTRNNRQRAVGMLRYYAGMATSIHGETIDNSLPGEIFSFTLKEPIGVVGAVERATDGDDLEDRPGAGDGLHGRAEACRGGAADAVAPGRALPGGRRAAGRGQRRAGLR